MLTLMKLHSAAFGANRQQPSRRIFATAVGLTTLGLLIAPLRANSKRLPYEQVILTALAQAQPENLSHRLAMMHGMPLEDLVKTLPNYLTHSDPDVRQTAWELLETIPVAGIRGNLIERLLDKPIKQLDADVLHRAIRLSWSVPQTLQIQLLQIIKASQCPQWQVWGMPLLLTLPDERGRKALQSDQAHPDEEVQASANWVLKLLDADGSVLPILREMLTAADPKIDPLERLHLARLTLQLLAEQKVSYALISALRQESHPLLRRLGAQLLHTLSDPKEQLSALKKAVSDKHPDVRLDALHLLPYLNELDLFPIVKSMMADPDQRIVQAAGRFLPFAKPGVWETSWTPKLPGWLKKRVTFSVGVAPPSPPVQSSMMPSIHPPPHEIETWPWEMDNLIQDLAQRQRPAVYGRTAALALHRMHHENNQHHVVSNLLLAKDWQTRSTLAYSLSRFPISSERQWALRTLAKDPHPAVTQVAQIALETLTP